MLARLGSRLTYANVVSTLALFLALSTGVAYAANEWTGENIVDGSLTGLDVAADSLGTNKIKDENLTATDLAPGSVGSSEVADSSITATDLGSGSVGSSEIATDAVSASEIADGSIDGGEIIDDSLHAADLASNSVGSAEIASGAVTNAKLGSSSVDSSKVASNSLTTADIAGTWIHGVITLSAGAVSNGRCEDFSMGVGGAQTGEAVVVSLEESLPQGILLYGTRVPSNGTVTLKICNLSGATMPAISDLSIRIITFH